MRNLAPTLQLVLVGMMASANAAAGEAALLSKVRAYADAMVATGRDTYGPVSTPLFVSCLDRSTGRLPEGDRLQRLVAIPRSDWGVRRHDRVPTGANPQHDQELYHLLYALDRFDGSTTYSVHADASLAWFAQHCQSPVTGLLTWGEHLGWDVLSESRVRQEHEDGTHEMFGNWELWDRMWTFDAKACSAFAQGLWDHQISDHRTGDFSRHASWDRHAPGTESQYPRHAGFYLATWASAARHGDAAHWAGIIDTFLGTIEARRHATTRGLLAETRERSKGNALWAMSELSMAIDMGRAADGLPKELAETATALRASAATTDRVVLALPHQPAKGSFVTNAFLDTLRPGNAPDNQPSTTAVYGSGYGEMNGAAAALVLLERAANGGDRRLQALALEAAECYRSARPPEGSALWPQAFAASITLELKAWRLTKQQRFLIAAKELAAQACTMFLDPSSPLPKATSRHDQYESITGGPALMLALLDVHWASTRPTEDPALPWCRR